MPSFQSTRPRGARLSDFRSENYQLLFQSTRPRGARLARKRTDSYGRRFQSTRPRGARRDMPDCGARTEPVSIHAPARGATEPYDRFQIKLHVSIHAPARGATCFGGLFIGLEISFNPRAREGRDLRQSRKGIPPSCFNPRAREGRDVVR